MSSARSERIATLLARGLSRIRKREGANWADREEPAGQQTTAPESQRTNDASTSTEDNDET
ncbi:hypothetical protein SH139x_002010 [Planctomycetaceae bacterium SH139]